MSEDSAFEWGGYSEIDVDSVDLELFPLIKEVHYSKVTMNKGDCIFMPGGELKLSINAVLWSYQSTVSCHTQDTCLLVNEN